MSTAHRWGARRRTQRRVAPRNKPLSARRSAAGDDRKMSRLPGALLLLVALGGCPSDGPCSTGWAPVFGSPLDRSVLSVFGTSRNDVYLVGGGLGVAGRGALALHYDGHGWREIPTGRSETLWWGFAAPGGGTDVWMVGEKGLILRYDGS